MSNVQLRRVATTMEARATLCLMVKAPVAGLAKTRLAPALFASGAAALAKALLLDAVHVWQSAEPKLVLATVGDFDTETASVLAAWPQRPQGQGCLGQRMERSLRAGLAESEVAIVHGTDIPGVGHEEFRETMRLMQTHDAVLGPCTDGGFYWLAVRRGPHGLLQSLSWSHARACEQTMARLVQAGMRVAILPAKFDVDTPRDLARLGNFLKSNPKVMPHTQAWLASRENRAISVIVPVRNEEKRLPGLLESLVAEQCCPEVIVVDGDSSDATRSIARSFAAVTLLSSRPGRAQQMNCGARAATGGTLLFLHADAQLPTGSLREIQKRMDRGPARAGAFRLRTRYDPGAKQRPWVRHFLPLADLRSRYSKLPYGDQGLFVRTEEFKAVGGYPNQPLFEDLHLSLALARRQTLAILPGPMVVSGRRFQDRPFYYMALMNAFPLLYRLGVSPRRLAALYSGAR